MSTVTDESRVVTHENPGSQETGKGFTGKTLLPETSKHLTIW